MKILHVITRLIVGGAQQNTVLSCGAQRRGGHEVVLAHGPIHGPEGSMIEEARRSGARLVEIPSMCRAVSPWRDRACAASLRELIRAEQPRVVHTHSSKAGILGRGAAWRLHVPAVIHTIHGLPFHARQGPIARRAFIAAERWAARRCHHLIAVTPAMVEAFIAARICDARKFTVIHSGVEAGRMRPDADARAQVRDALGIAPDAPVVGIVARLDPLKGHDDLLDVLPRLRERFGGLRMLFVGDGWERRRIERRIAAEGLEGSVILAGLVPHRDVGRMLAAMDVKVLPSYQEGQSRTLVEALLCGCGIVAYDAGGIGSICLDGRTGRLVPVGDRDALADAIAWMLEDPERRTALADSGRKVMRSAFDVTSMVEMIEKVYYEVLNRS